MPLGRSSAGREVVGGGSSSLAYRGTFEADTYTRKAGRRPIEDEL